MRTHAIQTGTVALKQWQVHGAGQGIQRRLNTLLDHAWTDTAFACQRACKQLEHLATQIIAVKMVPSSEQSAEWVAAHRAGDP